MTGIVGLLLASGFSRRFGSNKLLKPLMLDELVGGKACRTLRDGTDHVIAVVRPEQNELAELFLALGAEVVLFEEAHLGMGATIAKGVLSSQTAHAWLIALADMPWVEVGSIKKLAASLKQGHDLVAPVFNGRRGHPVGFGSSYRQELSQLSGDIGAKSIVERDSDSLILIPCGDPGVLLDIDTPADLLSQALTG